MTCFECGTKLVILSGDNGCGILCPKCGREPSLTEAIKLMKDEREKDEDSSIC